MQPAHRFRSHWAIRHSYVFIALTGVAMIFLASPVARMYQLSPEEYALASDFDEKGLNYKGKNFLEWRYGPLSVFLGMLYVGCAFLAAAIVLFTTMQVRAYLRQY